MKSIILLFSVMAILSIASFFMIIAIPSAFAVAGEEYTPTQPNAFASYNSNTNEVQVSWNFNNNLPADTVCFLKGDFIWYEDLNDKHSSGVSGVDYDKVTGFIPLYYSVVSSNPVNFVLDGDTAEVVPCENGSIRIDLDVIMSHSLNINNYEDLEIFLTFYVADADGSLNTADASRIDEVFVLFTPNNTFDTVAQKYGCGGQVGSTLYIDQSAERIHGNNGDNCDGTYFKYLELVSNQYVDIGMIGSGSHRDAIYGFHNDDPFQLLIEVNYPTTSEETKTGGGGGNEWDTRPTFGLNHKTFRSIIECGFSFDNTCYDITDNWHTDFDKIQIKTGETHTTTIKVLAEKKLKYIEFQLGVPEVGHGEKAEVSIFADFDHQSNITNIGTNGNAVDNIQITNSKVKCQVSDTIPKCDSITITFDIVEPLEDDIVGLQAIDHKNRVQTTYLNDGINSSGKSLNPMKTENISGTEKYEGLIVITQVSKYSDIWVSQDGREFQRNSSGSFVWINQTFEKSPSPEMSVMNRMHSEYYKLFEIEQDKALLIFDSTKLISLTPDSWTYDAPKSAEQKRIELDIRKNNEIDRITPLTKDYTLNQHLYQKDSYDHWNYFGDMSVAEINKIDLEKKLALQEQVYQNKLKEKAKYG